jgi:hypothetical protein
MSKLEVDKIDPQSGTDLELGTSGDTITIPAGVTFDSSAATNTLPSTVVTTTGTQTLTNKSIATTQLTGTITPSDSTVTTAKIVDANVTTAKIADANITLAKLSATGTQDATTFLRGDNTFASAGGTNTPNFSANRISGAVTFPVNTVTKLVFNNELYDSASAYDTSNGRFTVPSGQGGKYHFSATFLSYEIVNNNITSWYTYFYKNGSNELFAAQSETASFGSYRRNVLGADLELSAGDYIELYARVGTTGTAGIEVGHSYNRFSGFKLVE